MSAGISASRPPLLMPRGPLNVPSSRRSRFRQEPHQCQNPKDATSPVPPPPHAPVRSLAPRAGHSTRAASAPCPSLIESSNGCASRSSSARTCHAPIDAAGSLPRSASPSCSRTCCSVASRSTALANGRRGTLPRHSGSPIPNYHPSTMTASDLIGVTLLLKNVLLCREPLYGVGEWAARYAPEALGFADTQLPSLNDDRVGRCLDRLFRSDVTSLVLALATHVVREFQVDLDELHNDSTTITFHGAYADAAQEEKRGEATRMAITWGYNKDHRPDLKQLLYILTVSRDGAVPLYFQVASGNVVDDQTHCATWDLLCRLTGRRDFLYVADCKLASTENMAHIHQRQGRFLTVLPRTRSEDSAFRDSLSSGKIQWRHIHDKRDEHGQIVDQYSVSVPATLSVEGYRLVWYHSTRKAEQDAHTRHQQVERALIDLAELRPKLSSPRTRYRQAAKVAEAVQAILQARGVEGWIVTEIKERTEEKYRQDRRGRPSAETRYVKQTSTRFELEYRIDSVQLDLCDNPTLDSSGLED